MRVSGLLTLVGSLVLVVALSGCRGIAVGSDSGNPNPQPSPQPSPTPTPTLQTSVNHIIIAIQENRSFDHYFGQLGQYRAANGYGQATDIDGMPPNASNPDPTGATVNTFHLQTMCMENLTPDWLESHGDYNLGNLNFPAGEYLGNGFVSNAGGLATCCDPQPAFDTRGVRAIGYYDQGDLPYYYFMASNFATSNRWFSPLPANSVPNRVFGMAGTTHGYMHANMPAINVPNIFSELDAAGITWKYYYSSTVNGHPNTTLHNFFPTFANAHSGNFALISQYFTDVQSNNLAQVVYFQEIDGLDEHPGGNIAGVATSGNSVQAGAAKIKSYVDALMASPNWSSSVFLLTWDEGGGFYDHIEPQPAVNPDNLTPVDMEAKDQQAINPPLGYTGTGFDHTGYRVPLIVISPFTKKSYVSNNVADYTAFLKFIETRFNLPALTARDAAQMDMTEFFDFVTPPWTTPPASIPAQPTNGVCNNTLLPE